MPSTGGRLMRLPAVPGGPIGYTGETEFSVVYVDIEAGNREAETADSIVVTVQQMYLPGSQRIELTMDEARHVIAGLAAVVR